MRPFDVLGDEHRSKLRRRRMPDWVEPMKATLVHEAFSDPEWLFEPKLDGARCLAFVRGSGVSLMSRNRKRMDHSYPEIVEGLAARVSEDAILDGEVVALDGEVPSFSRLQRRMHVLHPSPALLKEVPVLLYLFDVLHLAGRDTMGLPLLERKRLLAAAVDFRSPLRPVPHREAEGEAYFAEICSTSGWEGLIAKRAGSEYTQSRSKDWLKFKCANQQEFVIGGFTDPQGARSHVGALLVGYYENGDLRYAGKVGTGFDRATLERLGRALARRVRKTSPFADTGSRKANWVTPDLVAEVGYGEWTEDGLLRHPRFLGLRRDKNAKDIVRERPS